MKTYKILKKKFLESYEKFERRLNETAKKDWRVVNITADSSGAIIALLEKQGIDSISY